MEDEKVRNTADRHWIAMTVLIGSFFGIIALGTMIIIGCWFGKPCPDAMRVFNLLLPVFGTWVGTLLAFYFTRENFKAASDSVTQMAREVAHADDRLKAIPVRDKMRAIKDILTWPMKPGEEDKSKLSDILAKFARLDRIPMLDDQGRMVYLVYKNSINSFLSQMALDPAKLGNKKPGDLTFKDLLDSDAKLKDLFQKSFGFVAERDTLADAKQKMEAISKTIPCNDIFVTQNGLAAEPIIGSITDNTISENLKV